MVSPENISNGAQYINDSASSYNLENVTGANITEELFSEALPHPDIVLPYSVLLCIAIYLTIVGILSTFGNVLFILTVIRWRYLRNNSHMLLLLNMAVSDLAISITGYPYTTVSAYVGKWIFGSLMCQLYAFLCFTFSQVNMNTLVAISVFRYIAICYPHKKHFLTSRTSMMALGIVWCHALFWTISPLVGWSSYTLEPTKISCSYDWNDRTFGGITYVLGALLCCYLFHIIVLVWCYRRIFQMVYGLKRKKAGRFRRSRRKTTTTTFDTTPSSSNTVGNQQLEQDDDADDSPPDSPPGLPRCQSLIVFSFTSENLTEMELHVLGMNISMVGAFLTFWSPYAFVSLISAFYDKLSPFWYIFPTIFAKTSCMINPILYGLTNKFLKQQLLLVLRGFLGLTTEIEDFQLMRQRQQDGLYNKEGIFVGKRAGAIAHCSCDGCVSAGRRIKLLVGKQKIAIGAKPDCNSSQAATKQETFIAIATTTATWQSGQGEDHSRDDTPSVGHDEIQVESCGSGDHVLSENSKGTGDNDSFEKKSQQQFHPSSASLSSNEFQQATVKAGGHSCSSNEIMLSVRSLFKDDIIDGNGKEMFLSTET